MPVFITATTKTERPAVIFLILKSSFLTLSANGLANYYAKTRSTLQLFCILGYPPLLILRKFARDPRPVSSAKSHRDLISPYAYGKNTFSKNGTDMSLTCHWFDTGSPLTCPRKCAIIIIAEVETALCNWRKMGN